MSPACLLTEDSRHTPWGLHVTPECPSTARREARPPQETGSPRPEVRTGFRETGSRVGL